MIDINLPFKIKQIIGNRAYSIDETGMSNSQVLCFDEMVLKIEKIGKESDNEHRMMEWLDKKLPVPKILSLEKSNGFNYLLMSRIDGEMSCSEKYTENPKELIKILADGLKSLWKIKIDDCPCNSGVDNKLSLAEIRVNKELCDVEDAEEGTYGDKGFKNPEALLKWLKENKPEEELVFSHGDYCLPNIFIKDNKINGYIDLGRSGVADKYQDIALCYRSLLHNYRGKHCIKGCQRFELDYLFEVLEIEPDWNKIKYYILMDELF